MSEPSGIELNVTITQSRYEELLETETRSNVFVSLLVKDEIIERANILRIFGYNKEADRVDEENKKKMEKYMKMENPFSGSKNGKD